MDNSNQLPEYVVNMYSGTQSQNSQQGKKPEDYINEMYNAALESEKAGLEQDYAQNSANLDAEQEKARKQTDANLTRTYVEAAKAWKNYAEVQNAYGLSSGAMAQARLAQDNQLQGDLTAIRAAQQTADANIERERNVLAEQYAAAIRQAQANNDLARAEALYAEAQAQEERLNQQKANAANLMAGAGDYGRLAELYGLSPEELKLLTGGKSGTTYVPASPTAPVTEEDTGDTEEEPANREMTEEERMAAEGDYAGLAKLYGISLEELMMLIGKNG